MRALVVEPHDVNELIFASYLSHPFLYISIWKSRGESTEGAGKNLFARYRSGCVRVDIDAPASQTRCKARILSILTDSQ